MSHNYWTKETSVLLISTGIFLSIFVFSGVMLTPHIPLSAGSEDLVLKLSNSSSRIGSFAGAILASSEGLRWAAAVIIALPWIWLPLAVARIFMRSRAGVSMVLLPGIAWLTMSGSVLLGNNFGIYDALLINRVDLVQGLIAGLVFLALTLTILISTISSTLNAFGAAGLAVILVAIPTSLLSPLAAISILLALATLLVARRWSSIWLPALIFIGASIAVWAVVELLSLLLLKESIFVPNAVGLQLPKLLEALKYFGGQIVVIVFASLAVGIRAGSERLRMMRGVALVLPALLIGLVSEVSDDNLIAHTPILHASFGALTAISVGGIVWSFSTFPSFVRTSELRRLSVRNSHNLIAVPESSKTVSAVIPAHNSEQVVGETLRLLGSRLKSQDEIIVVENGSTDGTWHLLQQIQNHWDAQPALVLIQSEKGLGNALCAGVLKSQGERIYITGDDLPFEFSDLDRFLLVDSAVCVAIGSKAHPDSVVKRHWKRELQSGLFRFLRAALLQSTIADSQGTFWVDGTWLRHFALHSRERSLLWTTEVTVAAEQQQQQILEVPVVLAIGHSSTPSRFNARHAMSALFGFIRLSIHKDDYADAYWRSN